MRVVLGKKLVRLIGNGNPMKQSRFDVLRGIAGRRGQKGLKEGIY
jgi:hypothetical protein